MQTKPNCVHFIAVPFSTRMAALNDAMAFLKKKKCSISTLHVGARSVVITLDNKPNFSGTPIKVVGGSAGLYQVYRKKLGLAQIEWRVPYFHKFGRVH